MVNKFSKTKPIAKATIGLLNNSRGMIKIILVSHGYIPFMARPVWCNPIKFTSGGNELL
ncbi:hypothetical protein GCM10025879_03400 [Leuconostoc litchii]|nr:hypothetical protein GCM10025879_03400 [Leuconostoc litchii]